MGAFSDYLEDKILNWMKGSAFPSAPATVYVGLLTAAPGDTGSGGSPSDGTEVSGNAYARQSITTASGWSAIATTGTDRHMSNGSLLTFPTPTPSGWGTVVAIGIWDASTAGNLLFWCAQTPNKVINAGDAVTIAATTGLVLSID